MAQHLLWLTIYSALVLQQQHLKLRLFFLLPVSCFCTPWLLACLPLGAFAISVGLSKISTVKFAKEKTNVKPTPCVSWSRGRERSSALLLFAVAHCLLLLASFFKLISIGLELLLKVFGI